MKFLRSAVIRLVCLLTLVGCGEQMPVKNSQGINNALGGGWTEELTIDPEARIGKDFWIKYVLSGAAGDIESTTISIDLPPPITVISGALKYQNLTFHQKDGHITTVWVRIDHLDAPILIQAQANGVFLNNNTPALAGSGLYLIPMDGKIIGATDIPQPTMPPTMLLDPITEIQPPITPQTPRPPRK